MRAKSAATKRGFQQRAIAEITKGFTFHSSAKCEGRKIGVQAEKCGMSRTLSMKASFVCFVCFVYSIIWQATLGLFKWHERPQLLEGSESQRLRARLEEPKCSKCSRN